MKKLSFFLFFCLIIGLFITPGCKCQEVEVQCCFPQPKYNSGWINIASLTDLFLIVNHNLSGLGYSNVDNYVIDLQYKDLSGNITHYDYGASVQQYSGAWWSNLNANTITVGWRSHHINGVQISRIRVRIWVYE